MALLNEYEVRILITFSLISRFVDSETLLLQTPGVRFCWRFPAKTNALLVDRALQRRNCPVVYVNRDYFNRYADKSESVLHFPFPLHPVFYQRNFHSSNAHLQGRMRILFAGNIDKRYYDDPVVTGRFGMVSRYQCVERIREQMSDVLFEPESIDELREMLGSCNDLRRMVLVDTSKCAIPVEQWLSVLDHADFFLALPGTKIPHCHNCIEALSRGSIPVLQYGKLFHVPLENGVNALTYHSAEECVKVLQHILAMDSREVKQLSEGALRYYETHLAHASFMRKFNEKIQNHCNLELIINAERRSLR